MQRCSECGDLVAVGTREYPNILYVQRGERFVCRPCLPRILDSLKEDERRVYERLIEEDGAG